MMITRRNLLIVFLLLGTLLVPAGSALAQGGEGGAVTLEVRAGYDGFYEEGAWLPLHVTVGNQGQPMDAEVRVVTGRSPDDRVVYNHSVSLPTQSHKRIPFYVFIPGLLNRLTVTLHDEDGRIVAEAESNRLELVQPEELLYGVVSEEPGTWTFLEQVPSDRSDASVALLDLVDLPEIASAWQPLDVLVLNNVDTGRISGEQRRALEGWLGLGGQLVVTGGPSWQRTAAGVTDLLPVSATGTRSVEDLPALRAQTGVPFGDAGPYVVTTGELDSGTLLLYQDEMPLLARRSWGRGAVYFLALDPTLAPLLDWRGNLVLWQMVASETPRLPYWANGPQNPNQAASALRNLSPLQLPPALGLFLFLMIYVAAVGPANYLLLKRLGRREWAWVTIPAMILLFSLLAYVTGFRLRGSDVIFNQMSVAFGQVQSDQMRVTSLLGIYSPRRATYDVTLPGDVLVRPFQRNLGTMAGGGNEEAITRGNRVTLTDLRVDVSGVETYVASSDRPRPPIEGRAVMRLEDGRSKMEIEVQNNGDFTLENAGYFLGTNFFPLGDLAPGESTGEVRALSASQSSAAAGAAGSGPAPAMAPGNPFSGYYDELLGTTDYLNDPQARPRFQLLESLQPLSRPGSRSTALAQGSITLAGWSEQQQFEVALAGSRSAADIRATTLYFLELPLENVVASGEDVSVPPGLLEWRVLAENGVFAPTIYDLYLPPGWIELEYKPWPSFSGMHVTGLNIVMQGSSSASPPNLRLWDWQEEAWSPVPNVVWGSLGIGNYESFLGEQNEIRIRLENEGADGVSIGAVYPQLTGDME